jgi:hypothetical protein
MMAKETNKRSHEATSVQYMLLRRTLPGWSQGAYLEEKAHGFPNDDTERARPEPALACVPLRLVDGNSHDKSHTSRHLRGCWGRVTGSAPPLPHIGTSVSSVPAVTYVPATYCVANRIFLPHSIASSFFFPSPFKDLTQYHFSTALSNQIT